MRGINRLIFNFFIVGGVLLFGALAAPRSSGFVGSSPGSGGAVIILPHHIAEGDYILRGMTLSLTFWGQTCPSQGNVTMVPVDCYIMTLEQYMNFLENNSDQALQHVRAPSDSIKFKAPKSGYYFFVLNISGPKGAERCIGYKYKIGGFYVNFLYPAIALLTPATALLTYRIAQRFAKKFK